MSDPSPPQADQVEAAQPKEPAQVLYEAIWPDRHASVDWAVIPEALKDRYRRGVAALRPVTGMRDSCQICGGRRGGVPGNENVEDGVTLCDYCHSDRMTFRAALPPASGSDHGPVGWRPIADAPRDGTFIWVYAKEPWGRTALAAWQGSGGDEPEWYGVASDGLFFASRQLREPPTLWQPLPPPPTGDK